MTSFQSPLSLRARPYPGAAISASHYHPEIASSLTLLAMTVAKGVQRDFPLAGVWGRPPAILIPPLIKEKDSDTPQVTASPSPSVLVGEAPLSLRARPCPGAAISASNYHPEIASSLTLLAMTEVKGVQRDFPLAGDWGCPPRYRHIAGDLFGFARKVVRGLDKPANL